MNEKNACGAAQFDDKGGTKELEWDGSSRLAIEYELLMSRAKCAGVRGQSRVIQTGKVGVNKQKEKLWTELKNNLYGWRQIRKGERRMKSQIQRPEGKMFWGLLTANRARFHFRRADFHKIWVGQILRG